MKRDYLNMVGKRYGRLVVLCRADDYVSPKGKHLPRLKCKCDCGNITYVQPSTLTRKSGTRSCGCLRQELLSERHNLPENYKKSESTKKKTEYRESGTALSLISPQRKKSKGKTSKYKGVYRHSSGRGWVGFLGLKGVKYSKFFGTEDQAHQWRIDAEKEYFNPILKKYGKAGIK